ncbi:MAG: hypothetical protein DU429_05265 [Candidatus Tokpelaia sp.]|nr:MAG: hypothetical protein DU430_07785 [Candidatus Tokpelaia sp.]KAA6206869.1 MAG: hypothetical protein DU429_05265 [Candidatus Tokpelaia sp.]KAA6404628.1 hypothetical protein DPQ22_09120 [Candidatus Tokpelaia sp.]
MALVSLKRNNAGGLPLPAICQSKYYFQPVGIITGFARGRSGVMAAIWPGFCLLIPVAVGQSPGNRQSGQIRPI